MNKTVNINLGGRVFHIDKDAYQELVLYFDAIKRYLSNSEGQEDIINDIKERISELLLKKLKNDKQVVRTKHINEIIQIMGQPEDYKLDDNFNAPQQTDNNPDNNRITKRLYRDKDKSVIGGVAAGFGHYLGISCLRLRIILIILIFASFGSGIIVYTILWFIIPAARTTSEKLEMTGKPINDF